VRPGQRVGKYVLVERIAQGGMAEVWGARVEGPEGFVKPVAMKFILENFSGDAEFERLFVNEARVAARLQHANLVTIFDFDKVPASEGEVGRYYIAMERVDGHDLRRVLQAAEGRGRLFSHPLALHVAGEVLKGLRYVHERRDPDRGTPLGLIHRDVSPHNVLVGMGGEVKLSDFGIAKAMTQSLGTRSGMIRGKLSYASPEQLRAEAIDHRTDQFALGIALWEMLTHRRLFDGADEVEIIGRVLRCEVPPMGDTPFGPVHPAIETIVSKMLSPAKEDRYPTTSAALSAVLAAPGYTHDGTILSNLMQEIFPETERAAAQAATVRMDTPFPGGTTPPPQVSPRGGVSGETRTITGSDLHRAASAPPPDRRPPRRTAGPVGQVTGSSYVSGLDEGLAYALRPRSRWPFVAGGILLGGAAIGAFFLLRPTQSGLGGASRLPSAASRHTSPAEALPLPEASDKRVEAPGGTGLAPVEKSPATGEATEAVVVPPRELEKDSARPASHGGRGRERAEHARGKRNPSGRGENKGQAVSVEGDHPPESPSKPEPSPPKGEPSQTRGPTSSNSAPIIP
jgi:serine/threonine-protein kinase